MTAFLYEFGTNELFCKPNASKPVPL